MELREESAVWHFSENFVLLMSGQLNNGSATESYTSPFQSLVYRIYSNRCVV